MSVSFSRLRQAVGLGVAETRPYLCRGCDTAFDVQYYICPSCGGFSVDQQVDVDGSTG